jgi:hypothetical protein
VVGRQTGALPWVALGRVIADECVASRHHGRRPAQLVVASFWISPVPEVNVKFESGNCITVESSLDAVGTSPNHITHISVNDNSVAPGNSAGDEGVGGSPESEPGRARSE